MSSRTQRKTRRPLIAAAPAVAMAAAILASTIVRAADDGDPKAFAASVVAAGRQTKLSRSPLTGTGVSWSGAGTAPKPAPGVTVAVMPCIMIADVCRFLYASAKEAAEAMGWTAFPIDNQGDPALAQRGVDAAINKGVNCVLTLSSPARDIRAQIQRGKEKGIAFVTGFSDDPRPFGGDVGYGLDYAAAGALLAAYVVANGGGGVVIFDAPQLPQLSVRLKGFKDYLDQHGGGLARVVDEETYSLTGGDQDKITRMQAVLSRFPRGSVQWVVSPTDHDLVALLKTAELRGRNEIHGVGFDGDPGAYDSLRSNGAQRATISWGLEWVAWAGIDECNRALNHAPTGVNKDFPIQLTDGANVPPPGQAFNVGFDFKSRYRAMWAAARNGN